MQLSESSMRQTAKVRAILSFLGVSQIWKLSFHFLSLNTSCLQTFLHNPISENVINDHIKIQLQNLKPIRGVQ